MGDIWDEKPDTWHETDKRFYPALEMDAWLEKLKTHYEPIEEKAELWDAFKGVVPSDSILFVVKPEYAHMSRGDMASKLEAVTRLIVGSGLVVPISKLKEIMETS